MSTYAFWYFPQCKEKNKKKRKPEDEPIRAEARWEDRAQRQDGAANREGKINWEITNLQAAEKNTTISHQSSPYRW